MSLLLDNPLQEDIPTSEAGSKRINAILILEVMAVVEKRRPLEAEQIKRVNSYIDVSYIKSNEMKSAGDAIIYIIKQNE